MRDFGVAEYVPTRNLTDKLLVVKKNDVNPGLVYLYRFRYLREESLSFTCVGCESHGRHKTVSVRGGHVCGTKSPTEGHDENCRPLTSAEYEALVQQRLMFREAQKGQQTPRQLYDDVTAQLAGKFADRPDVYEGILDIWRPYESLKSSLHHHHADSKTKFNAGNLPPEFTVTRRGRDAPPTSPYYREQWLLHQSMGGKVLVFSDTQALKALQQARVIVSDGTFDKCPEEFGAAGQLYNIRAYLGTEGVTIAHIFLPNRQKATYLEVWRKLCFLCEQVCKNFGILAFSNLRLWILDIYY
jgi:hypothetical protein